MWVKNLLLILFCMLAFIEINAQAASNSPIYQVQDPVGPKVFLIGEYEDQYNKLLVDYETLLLTACEYDMNVAYDKWMSMLHEMEAYADEINFDIKGTKFWLNVFWNKDGSVKHIAYHLKPISRNIDTADMSAFFSSFMNNYNFPFKYHKNYSHHGSVAFPLFPKRIENKTVTKSGGN